MNLNKYIMLIKTIECGSVTSAAHEMGISQSAATQLLASLEKEFRTTLIKRSKSGVTLTKDGTILLPLIKNVVEADAKLTEAVEKLCRDRTVIRIAAFKSVAVNWLPEIIKEYHHRFPNIRIELIDAGYNDIETVLTEKNIDIGFVPMPTVNNYKAVSVYQDRLLAVLPESYLFPGEPLSTPATATNSSDASTPATATNNSDASAPATAANSSDASAPGTAANSSDASTSATAANSSDASTPATAANSSDASTPGTAANSSDASAPCTAAAGSDSASRRCPVSLFASESVIALSDSIDRDARNVYASNGIIPNICYRVEDDYALLAMVEKGLGISIVPELILKGTEHHVKVMELDPPAFRTIGIAVPSEDRMRSVVADFYKFIIEYINSLANHPHIEYTSLPASR